jgi:hypothetical protein
MSPSPAPSRLSAARIDNREYCCVTPGCGLPSITKVKIREQKEFALPTLPTNDSYCFPDKELLNGSNDWLCARQHVEIGSRPNLLGHSHHSADSNLGAHD